MNMEKPIVGGGRGRASMQICGCDWVRSKRLLVIIYGPVIFLLLFVMVHGSGSGDIAPAKLHVPCTGNVEGSLDYGR